MKAMTRLLVAAVGMGLALGCSGSEAPGQDSSAVKGEPTSPPASSDPSAGGSTTSPSTPQNDTIDAGASGDAGVQSDGGGKPFGAACTVSGECASNVCFLGGDQSYCSLKCTTATAATDCPKPPTSGMCNNRGFCRKP